jgi:phage tail tube protein FII
MANQVWTLEDVNLFCGNGPNNNQDSNHLILSEMKLPGIDVQFTDHRAGGALLNMEINNMIARLESTFVLLGLTPQVLGIVNSWAYNSRWFSAFGVIRDQMTGDVAQAAAVMQGQLGRADPTNWTRGNVMHSNYSIRGIIHYEFTIAGTPIYQWDYQTNTLVVGGETQTAIINQLLQTGAIPAPPVLTNPISGWNQPVGGTDNTLNTSSAVSPANA